MKKVRIVAASVLAASAPLMGCSANVSASGDQADAEASASTAAVIVVERTANAGGSRSEATARFVRMRASLTGDDALRVVGAAVDFPATGTCVSLATPPAGARTQEPTPPVQLLDVGDVSMEANGLHTQLFARQVPDVVDLVSGVVYARATDAELLPARARYVLRVSGAADTEALTVPATAPNELTDLRVAIAPGATVDLSWEAGSEGDVVYVDVNGAPGARVNANANVALRCAFADSGRAQIAAALIPDEGTLTVHRLHRERFRARGIESGEMRFDFAKIVTFTRAHETGR